MLHTRRTFLKAAGLTGAAAVAGFTRVRRGFAQTGAKFAETAALRIGYEDNGNPQGFPIILLHGFPDDIRAWDQVTPPLVKAGHRVLVPYLRGYGPTRFRDAAAPRMAEQSAIGQDVVDFAYALHLDRLAVPGCDWGA